MEREYDFSKGVRGKFYRKGAELRLPIYLDAKVQAQLEREVSKLLPVGTIVLVYDKVSFVSAKSWVDNPKLKQAGLLISAADDEKHYGNKFKPNPKSIAIKKVRPRLIRAD